MLGGYGSGMFGGLGSGIEGGSGNAGGIGCVLMGSRYPFAPTLTACSARPRCGNPSAVRPIHPRSDMTPDPRPPDPPEPDEEQVEEEIEESFPSSDPPQRGGPGI